MILGSAMTFKRYALVCFALALGILPAPARSENEQELPIERRPLDSFVIYELKDAPGSYIALGHSAQGGWRVYKAAPGQAPEYVEQMSWSTSWFDGGTLEIGLASGETLFIPAKRAPGSNYLMSFMRPSLLPPGRAPEPLVQVRATRRLVSSLGLASLLHKKDPGDARPLRDDADIPPLPTGIDGFELAIIEPTGDSDRFDQNELKAILKAVKGLGAGAAVLLDSEGNSRDKRFVLVRPGGLDQVRAVLDGSVAEVKTMREAIADKLAAIPTIEPDRSDQAYLALAHIDQWHRQLSERIQLEVLREIPREQQRRQRLFVGSTEIVARAHELPFARTYLSPIQKAAGALFEDLRDWNSQGAQALIIGVSHFAGGAGIPLVIGDAPDGKSYYDHWLDWVVANARKFSRLPKGNDLKGHEDSQLQVLTNSGGIFNEYPLSLSGERYELWDYSEPAAWLREKGSMGNAAAVLGLPGNKRLLIKRYVNAILQVDRLANDAALAAMDRERFRRFAENFSLKLVQLGNHEAHHKSKAVQQILSEFWTTSELSEHAYAQIREIALESLPERQQLQAQLRFMRDQQKVDTDFNGFRRFIIRGIGEQEILFSRLAWMPYGTSALRARGFSAAEYYASALEILTQVVQSSRWNVANSATIPHLLQAKIVIERGIAESFKTRDPGYARLRRAMLTLNQELNTRFIGILTDLQNSSAEGCRAAFGSYRPAE